VQNPTEELCKLAVSHFGTALRYIDPEFHTIDVCMTAVQNYLPAIKLVKNESVEFWQKAFSYNPDAINCIDWYSQTPEMVMEAVKACGGCLKSVREDLKTPELCRVAVEARPDMIAAVPRKIQAQVYESLSDEGRVQIPEMYYKYCVFYLTSELEESLLKDPNDTVRAKMAAFGFK